MNDRTEERPYPNKGPNWQRIKQLRDDLAKAKPTKYRQFNMHVYIKLLTGSGWGRKVTIGELRKNGPNCGSAACLAGETVIRYGKSSEEFTVSINNELDCDFIDQYAQRLLNLTGAEAGFMFSGEWSWKCLSRITRHDAVKYLSKAIEMEDIFIGKLTCANRSLPRQASTDTQSLQEY